MNLARALCAYTAFATIAVAYASEPAAIDALICVDPSASLSWKTVTSPSPQIALDWVDGAVCAVVSVDGREVAKTSDVASRSVTIPLALPDTVQDERVVNLMVSYMDANGAVVSTESVMLGLVVGTKDGDAVCVKDAARRGHWSRASVTHPVVLLPENVSDATLGGESLPLTMDAPGWQSLSLTGGGVPLSAVVDGNLFSMVIGVRKALSITIR